MKKQNLPVISSFSHILSFPACLMWFRLGHHINICNENYNGLDANDLSQQLQIEICACSSILIRLKRAKFSTKLTSISAYIYPLV